MNWFKPVALGAGLVLLVNCKAPANSEVKDILDTQEINANDDGTVRVVCKAGKTDNGNKSFTIVVPEGQDANTYIMARLSNACEDDAPVDPGSGGGGNNGGGGGNNGGGDPGGDFLDLERCAQRYRIQPDKIAKIGQFNISFMGSMTDSQLCRTFIGYLWEYFDTTPAVYRSLLNGGPLNGPADIIVTDQQEVNYSRDDHVLMLYYNVRAVTPKLDEIFAAVEGPCGELTASEWCDAGNDQAVAWMLTEYQRGYDIDNNGNGRCPEGWTWADKAILDSARDRVFSTSRNRKFADKLQGNKKVWTKDNRDAPSSSTRMCGYYDSACGSYCSGGSSRQLYLSLFDLETGEIEKTQVWNYSNSYTGRNYSNYSCNTSTTDNRYDNQKSYGLCHKGNYTE